MRFLKALLDALFVLAVLLAFTGTASAAPAKKCPPKCHHRTEAKAGPCAPVQGPAVAPAPCASILDQLADGFELSAGFRWETEHASAVCPASPVVRRSDDSRVHDPFFVGATFRLPLTHRAGLFVNGDRDFTDAPNWQARVGLSYAPFRK